MMNPVGLLPAAYEIQEVEFGGKFGLFQIGGAALSYRLKNVPLIPDALAYQFSDWLLALEWTQVFIPSDADWAFRIFRQRMFEIGVPFVWRAS